LEQLLDEPSQTRSGQKASTVAIERLGTLFDEISSLGGKVGPYQTVCNYWNYWFTYLPEHITEEDQVGFAQRVSLVSVPGGTSPPNEWPRNPLGDYGGGTADGL